MPPVIVAGNQIWKLRRPDFAKGARIIQEPEELLDMLIEYFDWCVENPIVKDNIGWYEGIATHEETYIMRAMSVSGFMAHAGLDRRLWYEWKEGRDDLKPVIAWGEAIMFEQKFTGAAAGVLNASIIARELGLAEKSELSSPDGSMSPKPNIIEFVSPEITGNTDEGDNGSDQS